VEHQRVTTRFPTIEPGLSRKIGAGEGNRTLVISLEGPKRLHDIKANSDISVRFGPLRGNRNFPLSERRHCTALPNDVRDVIVLADGDEAGEAAARDCAWRWKREGRRADGNEIPRERFEEAAE
jgi:hypothetical protein